MSSLFKKPEHSIDLIYITVIIISIGKYRYKEHVTAISKD